MGQKERDICIIVVLAYYVYPNYAMTTMCNTVIPIVVQLWTVAANICT